MGKFREWEKDNPTRGKRITQHLPEIYKTSDGKTIKYNICWRLDSKKQYFVKLKLYLFRYLKICQTREYRTFEK